MRVEPDHAIIRLAVNRGSASPKTAFDEVATTVTAVQASMRLLGVPDDHLSRSPTRMASAWIGSGPERSFVGHQCRVELWVRVGKLDMVEAVVVDAVAAGADEVIEISYDTSQTADLRAEAREKAVAAAHAKAKLYAEAANVRLGPVVHIEDLDPSVAGDGAAPGQVAVSAAVVLGFSITR